MSEKDRKVFSSQLKAKVALEAIRGVRTANEGVWEKIAGERNSGRNESVGPTEAGPTQ